MLTKDKKAHFIGIGGIGMSGIAQLLLAQGFCVSGSDLKSSGLTEKLSRLGAQVFIGHNAGNVQGKDLVIYSAAIPGHNPELKAAVSLDIPVWTRAELLAQLANQKKSIAVTGAHGKTTTTSLISHLLATAGLGPTVCVGAELFNLNSNALLGQGDYFVMEADESDGSFLRYQPLYSVVTNIDREHLDYYRDLEHIRENFLKFMNNTKKAGTVFCCQDDSGLMELAHSLDRRVFSYGLSAEADISAQGIKLQDNQARFECLYQGRCLGELSLQIPGRHNVSNALAAIALGLEIGLEFKIIHQGLSSYNGTKRRLQLKLREKNILIFDDYAHHPTEIRASLEALKNFKYKRMLAIFQPHRYTRTKFLLEDFGRCFQGVDYLIITDIYAASEAPIKGVHAQSICQKAKTAQVKNVLFLPKFKIVEHLLDVIRPGDLVAVLGAGDIGGVADALAEQLQGAHPF
ncbi:MAG: UDP-N-acetylmuramate--L-alanine ligase [Candidatus Omnitrophica bacterium]|nr:UDP-N-acetylmuramate--L-alanine ligase [Candidatus Omnitrophota bacterium]